MPLVRSPDYLAVEVEWDNDTLAAVVAKHHTSMVEWHRPHRRAVVTLDATGVDAGMDRCTCRAIKMPIRAISIRSKRTGAFAASTKRTSR